MIMAKDHKVVIHTTDGESQTVNATAADARALEDLPFDSSNVSAVTVTPPR
jgi:hypothetical protein